MNLYFFQLQALGSGLAGLGGPWLQLRDSVGGSGCPSERLGLPGGGAVGGVGGSVTRGCREMPRGSQLEKNGMNMSVFWDVETSLQCHLTCWEHLAGMRGEPGAGVSLTWSG